LISYNVIVSFRLKIDLHLTYITGKHTDEFSMHTSACGRQKGKFQLSLPQTVRCRHNSSCHNLEGSAEKAFFPSKLFSVLVAREIDLLSFY
jgi:hypothetical protein